MKQQYNKINNLVGWITFVIAAFTYCMTIEPTASFWDCPEFITTGYKLEVGHPPGAPFFMLTANLFSQFASDPSQVAMMVNIMSALMSAACILFLFWSITHLTRKLICPDLDQLTKGKLISIMGAGVVGALAYTWSDTFWFSAVEGEVYAYSSLFTAIVFWLILKWENRADEPHSDRWLILIAYLTGLSIGVHLLNLLCIPAIVLVYYYKKHPQANLKGSLLALVGSMILVAAVLYGIVPGIVKVGGWFELLFVNSFGMPFNTGVIVYLAVLVTSLVWGVYESYTQKSRKRMNISFLLTVGLLGIPFYGHGTGSVVIGIIVLAILAIYLFANLSEKYQVSARTLNTSLLAMMMIVVGYSSYAVIVIRSSANTPMDQNSPEDIFTLGEYLGREQYGTRPLFYGQTYASKPALKQVDGGCMYDVTEGAPVYQRKEKERPDEKDSYFFRKNSGGLSEQPAPSPAFLFRQFTLHVIAGTELDPLFRFHHSVAVPVRAQIPVAHHLPDSVVLTEHPHQYADRPFLFLGPGVCRIPSRIQSPFIRNADAVRVMPFRMCARLPHRTHGTDLSVTPHVIMIPAPVESPLPVHPVQFSRREGLVLSRGRTVNDNQVNLSHSPLLSFHFPVRMQSRHLRIRTITFTAFILPSFYGQTPIPPPSSSSPASAVFLTGTRSYDRFASASCRVSPGRKLMRALSISPTWYSSSTSAPLPLSPSWSDPNSPRRTISPLCSPSLTTSSRAVSTAMVSALVTVHSRWMRSAISRIPITPRACACA